MSTTEFSHSLDPKQLFCRGNDMAPDIVQLNVRDSGFDIVVHAELPVANKVDWSDIKKIEAYRSD